MPIQTYVAGAPPALSALAEHLESGFAADCDDLEATISTVRRDLEDAWDGGAGRAAVDSVGATRTAAADVRDASRGTGAAVGAFASSLRSVQSLMEDARDTARAGGLVVTERLVEGPPPAATQEWFEPIFTPSSPPEELAFLAWRDKQAAYVVAERIAGDAISDLSDACQRLIEDLGEQQSSLAEIADFLGAAVPGAIEIPGERVLPGIARRMGDAATRAGFLASISPEQSRLLYANLFLQMDQLDDASLIRRVAALSDYGGKGVDGLMIGLSAIERHERDQGYTQILLAEGGGWVTGALATGGTWAAGAAVFGAPTTPVGQVILGGVALVVGTGVGLFTSNQVDDWYEDREFEEMLENADLGGDAIPAR